MTEATLAVPTPAAPALIEQLLSEQGVGFVPCMAPVNAPAAQCLQAVLLEDGSGALLVIFAQDQLLDLARITELTHRQLVCVSPERLGRMLEKHDLEQLPALPAMTSAPCLYDQQVLNNDMVYIQSGKTHVWLAIQRDGLKTLLRHASAATFGQPIAAIDINLTRPDKDRVQISQAVQAFTARRILQRLEETIEIPPLPETAQKIIKLRVNPDVSTADVTSVVETDPALAAQVVSWAASPFYAAPGKIRSVEDAIVRVLGFDLVINLALGLAMGKTLSLPKDQPHHAPPYWHQAIYSAVLIEGLARAMPREKRPEAGLNYLAGLLHNFGYLVLAYVFPPHFSLICRHIEVNPHLSHSYIEQHFLGVTREQVGAWLMRHWDMPEEICCALRFQHDANYDGEYSAYPNLLYLTASLLRRNGLADGPALPLPDTLMARLGLSHEQANQVLEKILKAEAALREMASQHR